ncbi:hypothetical protein EYF80_040520 [Scomber scombrus]|uniref:Uncharacterized protein n=1 Tax=Scomber scombrus TaxID=13677 RepID=A0AAV1NUP1_SCOSC
MEEAAHRRCFSLMWTLHQTEVFIPSFRNLKGQRSLQRHQMCAVMESRRERPFVRHQISPVPKAGPYRVSSAGLPGGETQTLRTGSGFCLHERSPWIPPTRADRGRQGTGRREPSCPVCLSTCLSLCMGFGDL